MNRGPTIQISAGFIMDSERAIFYNRCSELAWSLHKLAGPGVSILFNEGSVCEFRFCGKDVAKLEFHDPLEYMRDTKEKRNKIDGPYCHSWCVAGMIVDGLIPWPKVWEEIIKSAFVRMLGSDIMSLFRRYKEIEGKDGALKFYDELKVFI